LPWFRWLKKATTEDTAPDAVALQTITPADPSPEETETDTEPEPTRAVSDADGPETDAAKPKRRRGSRGGRGRKKSAALPGGETAEVEETVTPAKAGRSARAAGRNGAPAKESAAAKDSAERKDKDKDKDQRRRSGTGQRRKQPPRRAPLPAAKRELVISVDVGEQRVAILEDDKVAEVYLERPERRSIAGNIYLGVVDNVLPGMEAAFVEIGLEKNGFLYVDEIVVPELEGKRHGKKIQDLISRGEKLLVQAVKDPMKTKGARLTTEISLPGRFLVFVPNGEGLGVSRRLEESERQRLKEILKPITPAEGGVIVRTAAEGASAEDVERDLVFLQRLWKTIQTRSNAATAPELVYQEAELPLRIVRDLFAGDFVAAHVDSDRVHKRIVSYLKKTSPHMIERVHRWKEKDPIFERFGIEQEIGSTLDRRVDLPSGGYLIFDYAEAFTVIDVNTGRFVGSRSKTSTQRLEDTIVKNNLEAVKEVVRQLRLRDIGGIIVIDFIDMANAKNRQAVEDALRTELERDRTKTYVVEISPLGLVEMTRQNVTEGPREVMTRRCPTCDGDGIVVSDQTLAMGVERRLRALAAAGAGSRVQGYRVAVHPRTLALLAGPGGARLAALEEATRRRFFLVEARGHAHGDHLEVLAEGRLDDLRPETALEEGAELEVKLVEVGLHDPTAGVAKVDGVEIVVAGAAKLVGKKATVRVGRALEGQAFATLVTADAGTVPITFESEAEKPTRAPARRKPTESAPEEVDVVPADELPEAEPPAIDETSEHALVETETETDAEDGAGDVAAAEEVEGEGEERPKKRTRRGSRGGKRRKKKPVDVDGAVGDEHGDETSPGGTAEAVADDAGSTAGEMSEPPSATVPAPGDEATPAAARPRARRTPKIHVPATGGDGMAGGKAETQAETETQTQTPDEHVPASEHVVEVTDEPDFAAGEADSTEDGTGTPRKRTRRGSRGGRGRRKKPAQGSEGAGDGSADTDGSADADGAGEERALAVDAPEGTDGSGNGDVVGEPAVKAPPRPRKRTPRPAAPVAESTVVTADADVAPATPAAETPSAAAEAPVVDGYVPMSEWLDDFEQSRGQG
jgi:ribonuclease G